MVEQHDIEKSTLHPKRLWISKIEFTITSKEPLKNTWSNCWKHDIFWRTQFFWSTIPSFFVVVWRTNSPQKLCANDVQTLGTFFRHSNSILKTKDVAVKIHKNKKKQPQVASCSPTILLRQAWPFSHNFLFWESQRSDPWKINNKKDHPRDLSVYQGDIKVLPGGRGRFAQDGYPKGNLSQGGRNQSSNLPTTVWLMMKVDNSLDANMLCPTPCFQSTHLNLQDLGSWAK